LRIDHGRDVIDLRVEHHLRIRIRRRTGPLTEANPGKVALVGLDDELGLAGGDLEQRVSRLDGIAGLDRTGEDDAILRRDEARLLEAHHGGGEPGLALDERALRDARIDAFGTRGCLLRGGGVSLGLRDLDAPAGLVELDTRHDACGGEHLHTRELRLGAREIRRGLA
jgi:hypothetical protein